MTKKLLLIITGGVAAYKSLELIRDLKKKGYLVRTVLTQSATSFVTPLSVQKLSGEKVFESLFSLEDEESIGHIALSREADLVAVVPATANFLAKMAHGIADDLASTLILATDKPVLVAPAMNVRMWDHPATQANVACLKERSVVFVDPEEGEMACGEFGLGRLAEVSKISQAIQSFYENGPGNGSGTSARYVEKTLSEKRVLVTSGPTYEDIDPVRFIGNRSSGKQGYAIAKALAEAGAKVTLVSGPVALDPPLGVKVVSVRTALQMYDAVKTAQTHKPFDAVICAAAVADWRVETSSEKIKKGAAGCDPVGLGTLTYIENPDILKEISQSADCRPKMVIGFAAETQNLLENAAAKLERKNCNLIIANSVAQGQSAFDQDDNTVTLLYKTGERVSWPKLSKIEIAQRLVEVIALSLNEPS